MSRIDVSKLHPTVLIGAPDDTISVPKIVVYLLLEPDGGSPGETTSQGYSYGQRIGAR